MKINLTLIMQSISFVLFVWFCMRFVWPPMIAALTARKKQISDGLAAADKGLKAEAEAMAQAETDIAAAKSQANEIISKAEKRGSEIVDEAKADAKAEAGRILVAANAEIDQEFNRAKEQLRTQVASIVIQGAEKVLEKEIDEKAHTDIVNKLVAEI